MINPTLSTTKHLTQQDDASYAFFSGCQPAGIQLNDVAWSPYRDKTLLKPITVTVHPGEFLAIVGPNGSGKTSLLRCLYRTNKPTNGTILLDGKNLWSLSPRQCAQRIATVLQDTGGEFGLSVFEMVEIGLTPKSLMWGRSEEDTHIIESTLVLLDVAHLADRSFDSLSGGERQRVMIARALAQRPDVLILDEPTNHLDIRHQLDVLALLSKLPCTIIVSLHDLALASAYADRVLIMQEGEMKACAPPNEVFTKQRIKQVFDVETIIDEHPVTQRPRFSFYIND
ncbi:MULTISPECIES: ABC transporter ATP-binding protein [Marinomonas]|uniref:ABC transporter ATP-binding protein n=1 Tax=Marinomonas arctica TaxID=383750 RepID=A0A7H1J7F5_9GAMM|nr:MULTISPECIES: ABC transporter ATP-binding protein [Marinomonas]QNT06421.1 ABC transporter ATP-binding protein [Marinomonas arctica]GGN27995.1 ABC transporter ATP-binding protein [Marinomonas arctica]